MTYIYAITLRGGICFCDCNFPHVVYVQHPHYMERRNSGRALVVSGLSILTVLLLKLDNPTQTCNLVIDSVMDENLSEKIMPLAQFCLNSGVSSISSDMQGGLQSKALYVPTASKDRHVLLCAFALLLSKRGLIINYIVAFFRLLGF